MKKIFGMLLIVCILLTSTTFAFAADTMPFKVVHGEFSYDKAAAALSNSSEALATPEPVTPSFTVRQGTYSYAPPESSNSEISPMATTRPTSLAPSSFYNVKHYWTATNYTWSSYMFTQTQGYTFDCRAKQKFSVDFYLQNGTYEGTTTATYNSSNGLYCVLVDWEYNSNPYYVRIVNKSSSPISSNAFYYVSDSQHQLPFP